MGAKVKLCGACESTDELVTIARVKNVLHRTTGEAPTKSQMDLVQAIERAIRDEGDH